MSRFLQWLIVNVVSGVIVAASFVTSVQPLSPLGLLSMSFWVLGLITILVGIGSALVLIDLKRAFGSVLGITLFATLFYALALWSPAALLGHYSTHLMNYAMVQAVPVLMISVVLLALGAMIGTALNSSVREFDL